MSSTYRFWTPTLHEAAGGPATVTPATVVATVAVPTPVVAVAATVTPATVVTSVTVDTPDVAAASVVTPATVVTTVTIPTPTVVISVNVTPATVVTTVTIPTPTIDAASAATVTPATVAITVTIPTPTIPPTVSTASVAINIVRFYRVGAVMFVLARAVTRGSAVGYNRKETWAPSSVPFNDPGEASGNYYDIYDDIYHRTGANRDAMYYIAPVWVANKTDSDADLMTKVNAALVGAGYDRGHGKPIL